jgi:hypothetical protein
VQRHSSSGGVPSEQQLLAILRLLQRRLHVTMTTLRGRAGVLAIALQRCDAQPEVRQQPQRPSAVSARGRLRAGGGAVCIVLSSALAGCGQCNAAAVVGCVECGVRNGEWAKLQFTNHSYAARWSLARTDTKNSADKEAAAAGKGVPQSSNASPPPLQRWHPSWPRTQRRPVACTIPGRLTTWCRIKKNIDQGKDHYERPCFALLLLLVVRRHWHGYRKL